jgi:hypothetical protein
LPEPDARARGYASGETAGVRRTGEKLSAGRTAAGSTWA